MANKSELYEKFEKEFGSLVKGSAQLETVYTNCRWAEGPVWFDDANHLLWSDIPNDRIMRYVPGVGTSVFRENCGNTNGHTRDNEGRLISCSHGNRHVERTEVDGSITVLADSYGGKKLNSPNDVIVKSDGSIWFSDPAYGIESDYEGNKGEQEQDGCYVYRIDPDSGKVELAIDDFDRPNGLCFSPDEKILYVSDSALSHGPERAHHIRAFDIDGANKLTNDRVFAEITPGLPDGFRADTDGNIWTSAGDGVHVYTPSGVLLGKIHTPKGVANVTFAGPKRNWLCIAATDSMHILYVAANGAQRP